MANTTDFISAVYDQLAKQLNVTDSVQSVLMQMEWPGQALSPADFKRANAPNGPYDVDVAKEAFSRLANLAPVFNKSRFENSGFEVEDLYELILLSAIPVDATPQTIATNPIHKLFLDAQFDLDQARRASQ